MNRNGGNYTFTNTRSGQPQPNGGQVRFTPTGGPPQNFNESPGVQQWRVDNALRRQEQAMTTPQDPQQVAYTQIDPIQINFAAGMVSSEEAARNRAIVKAGVAFVAVKVWQAWKRRH